MQQVINRDKYAHLVYAMYEISTGPHEYVRVMIGMPNLEDRVKADIMQSFMWDVQVLLDLAGEADKIIENKTLAIMQNVFAEAHGGLPDDN